MNYDDIVPHVEALGYRDKLRLAQLLVQLARKEEEEQNPSKRTVEPAKPSTTSETVSYVAERLVKLRPSKKTGVLNSISAMFQFQGGISEEDRDRLVSALIKGGYISIDGNSKVQYLR